MNIYRKNIHFDAIDPFGDGLGDDIAHERREPEAIVDLSENIDAVSLANSWSAILESARQEPDFYLDEN